MEGPASLASYSGFAETQSKLFNNERPRRVKSLLYVYRVLPQPDIWRLPYRMNNHEGSIPFTRSIDFRALTEKCK